jgi:hypothetical protein
VRVPKPHRVTDKALLKALRIGYCELCGRVDMECGVHHIITRGAAGPDARCNLVCLCNKRPPRRHTTGYAKKNC